MRALLTTLLLLSWAFSQETDDTIDTVKEVVESAADATEDTIINAADSIEETVENMIEGDIRESDLSRGELSLPQNSTPEANLTTNEIVFRKDVVVDSGEVSEVNLRIFGGNLTVLGTLNSTVTLIGGDAYLKSGSVVNGKIITIGGNVYKDPGAIINGKIIESNLTEGLIYRETERKTGIQGRTEFDLDQRSERTRKSWIHPVRTLFIYNRNEGLVFTPFNTRWDRASLSNFRFSWSLGIRMHKGMRPDYTGRATLEKSFFQNRNVLLYGSLFNESRTDDGYRLPRNENSISSVLARQDFFDRWNEMGWEVGLGLDFIPYTHLKVRAVSAEQDSLPLIDLWSLFEKKRLLRSSPFVPSRQVNYYEVTLASRTPNFNPLSTGVALYLQSEFIQADDDTAALFNMDRSSLIQRNLGMVIMNLEFSPGLVFRTRLMAGSYTSADLTHRDFYVGGLGSVSAQPYKGQRGNMMAQVNLALMITPEFIDDDWIVTVFADGGHAWLRDEYKFDIDKIKKNGISSAGFGFGNGDDDLDWMVRIAKPMDRSGSYETTIRINYNF